MWSIALIKNSNDTNYTPNMNQNKQLFCQVILFITLNVGLINDIAAKIIIYSVLQWIEM